MVNVRKKKRDLMWQIYMILYDKMSFKNLCSVVMSTLWFVSTSDAIVSKIIG